MAEDPWVSIIGLGEDGLEGLSDASRRALSDADVIMGAERHLSLLPTTSQERITWPVPFATGLEMLGQLKGRKLAVLASGDPFWFGAGRSITQMLSTEQWKSYPTTSSFSLVASTLGWPLEDTVCLGLHAAPLTRLRVHLAEGQRIIVLVRDASALDDLATCLESCGFGDSNATICSAMGGPRQSVTHAKARDLRAELGQHPVAVAIDCIGQGLPRAPGLPDDSFEHDGQITKAPIRALTLAALAPRTGEVLWDIGGGSGSIAIEWMRVHPKCRALCFEQHPERAERIKRNALKHGVDQLRVICGTAPDILQGHDAPDAIFVGGGLSDDVLHTLQDLCPGVRLVANAVTLESETTLQRWHAAQGGALIRLDFSRAVPLGARTGWKAAFPIVQWSGVL